MKKLHQAYLSSSFGGSPLYLGCSNECPNSSNYHMSHKSGSKQTGAQFLPLILKYGCDDSTLNELVHPDGCTQAGETVQNTFQWLFKQSKYLIPVYFLLTFLASVCFLHWYYGDTDVLITNMWPWQLDKTPFAFDENTCLQIEEHSEDMTKNAMPEQICSPLTREECTAMEEATLSEKQLLSYVYHLQVNTRQLQTHVHQWKAQTLALKKNIIEIQKSVYSLENEVSARSNEENKFTEEDAKQLIDGSISLYDADKVGLPDFALESAGGRVISTPDTVTYNENNWITLWGFRLWQDDRSNPRRVIESSMDLGNCWKFYGATGKIIIQLSAATHITAVTIDHIPTSLTLTSKIDSAPKDFAVYGIKRGIVYAANYEYLGSFSYSNTTSPRQTFFIDENGKAKGPFSAVKLWIKSNHGHPIFTCIYRFRVHGKNSV